MQLIYARIFAVRIAKEPGWVTATDGHGVDELVLQALQLLKRMGLRD